MRRLAAALLLLLLASPACDEECDDAAFYVAGNWASAFHCSSTGPDGCFVGTDTLVLTQDGDAAAPGQELTFSDGAGGQFSGTLCGRVFTWTGRGTDYAESGTWTFDSADRFSKATGYANDDGNASGCCAGEGARMSGAAPMTPAMCPTTACAAP